MAETAEPVQTSPPPAEQEAKQNEAPHEEAPPAEKVEKPTSGSTSKPAAPSGIKKPAAKAGASTTAAAVAPAKPAAKVAAKVASTKPSLPRSSSKPSVPSASAKKSPATAAPNAESDDPTKPKEDKPAENGKPAPKPAPKPAAAKKPAASSVSKPAAAAPKAAAKAPASPRVGAVKPAAGALSSPKPTTTTTTTTTTSDHAKPPAKPDAAKVFTTHTTYFNTPHTSSVSRTLLLHTFSTTQLFAIPHSPLPQLLITLHNTHGIRPAPTTPKCHSTPHSTILVLLPLQHHQALLLHRHSHFLDLV